MKNHPDPAFTKQYLRGYAFGMNPAFNDCEDCSKLIPELHSEAFISGFTSGRTSYEFMNGKLRDGVPKKIVTDSVLERFFLRGELGMPFITEGYTVHQQQFIYQYYESGYSHYDPERDVMIARLLTGAGISPAQ